MNRLFAPFDAAGIGPDLSTERGDTVVLCSEDGRDHHRLARSLFAQDDDQHDVELLFWSPADSDGSIGVANTYAGIVTPAHALNKHVGEQATGYGYCLDSGKVYCNGVVVATWAPAALGDVIRLSLNVNTAACSWYRNDTLLGTLSIPPGEAWHYAVTVSGGPAGSLLCYCNAGQQAFVTPDPSASGWWQALPQIGDLWLSTEHYLSRPDDADPHRRYSRALASGGIDNSRAITFWMWEAERGESGGGSIGSVDIVDPLLSIVPLLMEHDIRDQPVTLAAVLQGGSQDDAVPAVGCVVETIERTSDRTARITLRDTSVELEVPVQPRLILPNADASSVDKPWPALFGAVRSASLVLIDAEKRRYAVSHQPLAGVGSVRCNGRLLDPTAITPDFTLTQGGTCIDLREDLQGRITFDATAQGQYNPGSGVDLLAGMGDFEAMSSTAQLASLWIRGGGLAYTSNPTYWPRWNESGNSIGRVEFWGTPWSYPSHSWITTPTNVLLPGRVYRARLYIEHIPGISDRQGWLAICGRASMSGPVYEFHRWLNNTPQTGGTWEPGFYEWTFRNTADTPLPFTIYCRGETGEWARVRSVALQEMPSALDVPSLEGIPLAEYVTQVLALARCRPDLCDIASAQAIDDSTGYRYGTQVVEQTSAGAVLSLALRSCTAAITPARTGMFDIRRFVVPDDVDDADVGIHITESMLLAEPRQWLDRAQGLTARISGGRNIEPHADSDFDDDFDPTTGVPMSVRRLLTAPYRWTASSGVQLAGCYRHALSAPPLETAFDQREYGLAELDRVLRGFRVPRFFSELKLVRPHGINFDPGRVYRVTYAPWGYAARKVFLCAVATPDARTATLTIWS